MHTIGILFGHLAAVVAIVTVCCLPWLLGGVVPLARVVLLCGAVVAGSLSVLSNLLMRRRCDSLPLILAPLAAMALLGLYQLRPAVSPVRSISHGVSPLTDVIPLSDESVASLSSADTRSQVGLLFAASIIAFVCFDQIRDHRSVTVAACCLVLNGVCIMTVGVSHLLPKSVFSLNEIWSLTGEHSFATFVNPNSAAGWLCLPFAVAAGWLAFHLKAASIDAKRPMGPWETPLWEKLLQQLHRLLANITVWNILPVLSVALLAVGVAATRSRGGILAIAISTIVALALRSSVRRLPVTLLVMTVCGGTVYGLLHWLKLDEGVAVEMETLRDLNVAAGARPEHWLNSLHAVLDFPLTGTGLGSYRFATLPYQSAHHGVWFRHADNQYVEMLVEGGSLGFLLFIGIGVSGLLTGVSAWRFSEQRRPPKSLPAMKGSRRMYAALGMCAVLATLSQAVSGFFDFGVGMPPACLLLTMIVSVAAGVLHDDSGAPAALKAGAIHCGRLAVVIMQILLIAGGAAFISDQSKAADVDRSVVSGHRLLTRPMTVEKLDRLQEERSILENRLAGRPDDPEGLRMLSRLAVADFRWRVMLAGHGEAIREHASFGFLYEQATMFELSCRFAAITQQDPDAAAGMLSQLVAAVEAAQLQKIFLDLQLRFPLMPNIAVALAAIDVLHGDGDEDAFVSWVETAQFVEPANAKTLFMLGALSLRCGKADIATRLWARSSQLSLEFQSQILMDARNYWEATVAMELFGPRSYVECVRSAEVAGDRMLKAELWARAEQLWSAVAASPVEDSDLMRGVQLHQTGRSEQAIQWLKDCVVQPGNRLPHRRYLARVLEESGRYMDALIEWHAIRALAASDAQADAAIARLNSLE